MDVFRKLGHGAIYCLATNALAQIPAVTGTLTWTEVITGASTPVPFPNGTVDPGESARINLSLSFTPPVGSAVSYQQPPPGGIAPVAGLSNAYFSLFASGAMGGAWSNLETGSGFIGHLGTRIPDGSLHLAIVLQPNPAPGNFPLPTNPLPNVWQAVWEPANYEPRLASFQLSLALDGVHLFVHTGFDPLGNPTFGYAEARGNHNQAVTIPIAPAPGSVALIGMALVGGGARATRRRDRVGL